MNKTTKMLVAFSVFIIGVSAFLTVKPAGAVCSKGENILKTQGTLAAQKAFEFCALGENEETAQIWLAQFYQNKKNRTASDKMKMIFYYHLAAENGNAHAQVALAKHLLQMDSIDSERRILESYMSQMQAFMSSKEMLFKGKILHPYALLMLASEDASQKWYYPTTQKSDGEARVLLSQFNNLPSERKKEYVRQASLWKQQKMKEAAQEVMSTMEYQAFMDTVYPVQGKADAYARTQAIEGLREKINAYLN